MTKKMSTNAPICHRVTRQRGTHSDADLSRKAALIGYANLTFVSHDLFFLFGHYSESELHVIVSELIDEPFTVRASVNDLASSSDSVRIEVALRPGVTDRVANQLTESAAQLGFSLRVATGAVYEIFGAGDLNDKELEQLVSHLLSNPVIETWAIGHVEPSFSVLSQDNEANVVEVIAIRNLDDDALAMLNKERGLALDIEELRVVREWFVAEHRDPTDAELETIAQTWSEHCSHKTFTASIETQDGVVQSLLSQLRASTQRINAPFVVSAFDGNAGIVQFPGLPALAIKAETHNHPSAVEPFGGANTGVGGVIRDVLAAPARPVALTDVLCFGLRDADPLSVPQGVLHPSVVEEGVVAGIADYGNKMGIPTVAGAVVYDEGFTANPLVFCGCVGEVLEGYNEIGQPQPGDHIVVLGGATGRDGIKGATFSSMTMDASTGEVAGASVQIGDPIVERLVSEALVDLLDRATPLCTALTDCGAGGLSSAVGEMAEGVGAIVHLEKVTRKYAGLAPWEVWLSEAQERMVLAVAPSDVDEVFTVCRRYGVQCDDIGSFTGTGRMVVVVNDKTVVDLPTDFMHDGRPQRKMRAVVGEHKMVQNLERQITCHEDMLFALLAHPTIASKEAIIRRYDHEILGATVLGPMSAPHQTGPSDAAVIASPRQSNGFAIGIGVNPQYGRFDPFFMAWAAVDEAIRNVVATGADPSAVALLDNFSWGDPRREETLGDLVAAVNGCCQAAEAYGAPFVSGKDSLNNEFEGSDGQRQSIPPTLVITALAHMPNADAVVTPCLKNAGNVLLLVGATANELRGSHLDLILGQDCGGSVPGPNYSSPEHYRALHTLISDGYVQSAHDVSEGGLSVALAEMVLASTELGLEIHLDEVHNDQTVALYSESSGRIIVEISPADVDHVVSMVGKDVFFIGSVVEGDGLVINDGQCLSVTRSQLTSSWSGAT